jgi:type VI secretion system protein ImpH
MAAANGRKNSGLIGRLLQQPQRFDFFQAVRLLEHYLYDRARRDPRWQRQPVGRDHAPEREVVHFRSLPALSFPPSAIAQIRQPAAASDAPEWEQPPLEMVVAFLGLTGPSGVLPHHYTALLMRRLRDKDYSLRDYFDLFNHRLISLFYRAWEKYRLPFAYERSRLDLKGGASDVVTRGLFSLVGLGTDGLRGRLDIPDEVFLYYSGQFAHEPRTALGLEGLLQDYFAMPVRVLQSQGQWLFLEKEDQAVMPGSAKRLGQNVQMGVNLVVGERVWDIQCKIRLRLGPLSGAQFHSLLPSGSALRPLCQMIRFYIGVEFDFDVQLVLRAAEVPWCRLGSDGDERAYLGWNTWVRCDPCDQDVADTVFFVEEA